MKIRNAILAAADHIEAHPKDFNFYSVSVPACGTPGCALGWISSFLGYKQEICGFSQALDDLGYQQGRPEDQEIFYRALDGFRPDWRRKAAVCAAALRAYADAHHPAEPTDAIPRSVRALFDETPAFLSRQAS